MALKARMAIIHESTDSVAIILKTKKGFLYRLSTYYTTKNLYSS